MFQQMQYFIAIVDHHSFTQAAVACHISQSAISQQMKELESQLGVTLLQRAGRSFTVTEADQYFYTHSQMILASVEQLVKNTVKLVHSDDAVLHIGYLRSFGTTEFLQAVANFTQQFPQVQIKITSGTHEQLFELLRTGQIDLNFSNQRRALSNEYQNEFLTTSNYVVAVSRKFAAAQNTVEISELAELPCILVIDEDQSSAEESYYRDILGVQSNFTIVKSYVEAQLLIAANQGYLITNQRMQTTLDQSIVQVLTLTKGNQQLTQQYYAYWQIDNSGYYIKSFADLLKQCFA